MFDLTHLRTDILLFVLSNNIAVFAPDPFEESLKKSIFPEILLVKGKFLSEFIDIAVSIDRLDGFLSLIKNLCPEVAPKKISE